MTDEMRQAILELIRDNVWFTINEDRYLKEVTINLILDKDIISSQTFSINTD